MAMKNTRLALVGLAILLLVTGCYPGTLEEAVNNSGQTLTVISMDTELKETTYTVGSNQTIRIKVPYKLRVKCGGETWDYDFPATRLPEKFRKRVRGNWYLEKFQIEKDGAINVLSPDSPGPVANPPVQPSGYPVRPK
jgi:hypothetical protein